MQQSEVYFLSMCLFVFYFCLFLGLPPEYGLHSIFDGIVYAIFGTCKDVNISTASILAVFLTPYVNTVGPDGVLLLTFLTGVIILAAGIFNLGKNIF